MTTGPSPGSSPASATSPTASSGATPSTPTSLPSGTKQVVVNGKIIKVRPRAKLISVTTQALYSASVRYAMQPEQKVKLIESIVTAKQEHYKMLDLKLDDPDKLETMYDLDMTINKTIEHHTKYDLVGMFSIICFDANGLATTRNLFTHFPVITEEEVANSNAFYTTMIDGGDETEINLESMGLSYDYLASNSDPDLHHKVMETYRLYPPEKQGGPLYFKISMDFLQDNSDESAQFLINTLKAIRITNFDGENIEKVVSLIRGAVKRLQNLKTKTGADHLPTDLAEHLIRDVFTSSSVPKFNDLFTAILTQNEIQSLRPGQRATAYTVEQVLKFAEVQYRKLQTTDSWTGVSSKTNATAFLTLLANHPKNKPICFNCGKDHPLAECKETQNVARIKANKKAFWDAKRKKGADKKTGSGRNNSNPKGGQQQQQSAPSDDPKYAPPTEEERKNGNRRTIDGKPHYYFYKKKKWFLDKRNGANNANASQTPAVPPAAPTGSPAPSANSSISTASASGVTLSQQQFETLLTNAAQSGSTQFRNLLSQFSNAGN